jgi:hypothetical protein
MGSRNKGNFMDSSSKTPHAPGTLPFVDMAFGQQIANLRREIESIQGLNTIYRSQRPRRHEDRAANEKRKVRLEQIVRQLAVLRSHGINAHTTTT